MFSLIRKIIGQVVVEETSEKIRIVNLPVNQLTKEISDEWGTSRIAKHMFISATGRRIEIPKFFGVELLFMLQRLADKSKTSLALKRVIAILIKKLKEETWLKALDQTAMRPVLDRKHLSVFHKSPLKHQDEFFAEYEDNVSRYKLNGYMLGSPAGSGKTLMGLMLAEMHVADRIIVICPKNAIERVWLTTIREEYKRDPGKYWSSLDGTNAPEDARFYVVHYEAQDRLLDLVRTFNHSRTFIILDESHNLNEIKSARTQKFVDFCAMVKPMSVLWASGTPIKAMGQEMIPFLYTIDNMFTEKTAVRFKKIFGMSQSRAVEILSHRLGISSYRIDKSKVVAGTPMETDVHVKFNAADRYTLKFIRVEMQAFIAERVVYYQQRRQIDVDFYELCLTHFTNAVKNNPALIKDLAEYRRGVKTLAAAKDLRPHIDLMVWVNRFEIREIMPNIPAELRKEFKSVRSVIKYLHLKIRGEALGRVLGKRRTECAVEMVQHMGLSEIIHAASKKTLIFSSFVAAVEEAFNHLTEDGFTPLVVHGGTSKDLPSIVNRYDKDEKIDPLIATYQSLSTAVPLIMANVCVLMDQPYRSHDRIQAISRVHRIGQDEQVYVINMLLDTGDETNVSTRSLDIMKWSQDQVDIMMGVKTASPDEVTLEGHGQEEIDQMTLEELDGHFLDEDRTDIIDHW